MTVNNLHSRNKSGASTEIPSNCIRDSQRYNFNLKKALLLNDSGFLRMEMHPEVLEAISPLKKNEDL